ncbi:MAG: glycerol-3-phosphate dehydrogenase [FCB group bacterium]|nr:glycerol-3-phosphate dehydrogenase [FCB group bacterium]
MIKQAVLGCGRWGSFHLWYGSRIGNEVYGWEPAGFSVFEELMKERKNEYLELPTDVSLTNDLSIISEMDIIMITVPAQSFRGLAKQLSKFDLINTDIVLCMKGIELGSHKRLTVVAAEENIRARSISIWVGPGHPQQFIEQVPSCMLIVSEKMATADRIARMMGSDLIRFYRSIDLPGCELGAAAKNVIGIAAGFLDGLRLGGLKGALMARAPQEVGKLISAIGGDWRSVYGLSHLGDYEATLFSPFSRNRRYGEMLVRGEQLESLAEGVATSHAIRSRGRELGVDMPITSVVSDVIDGLIKPEDAVRILFKRPEKTEFPDEFNRVHIEGTSDHG